MGDATETEIPSVDERRDDEFVPEFVSVEPPVYVDPEPAVGTARDTASELADLRAAIAAQTLVINTLAASCDWLVQNLTQVFQFVATMQNAGGPAEMMKVLMGGGK